MRLHKFAKWPSADKAGSCYLNLDTIRGFHEGGYSPAATIVNGGEYVILGSADDLARIIWDFEDGEQ